MDLLNNFTCALWILFFVVLIDAPIANTLGDHAKTPIWQDPDVQEIQIRNDSVNAYYIHKTSVIIHVDGLFDEEVWDRTTGLSGFIKNFPDDSSTAKYQTTVKLLFDDEYLYVAARMQRNPETNYAVESLKKDFTVYDNDAFGIILDPFADNTNGYGFYVNAFGALRDEAISRGTSVDATIDFKWNAEVHREPDYWQVEIGIPLRSIRHSGYKQWNVNFVRNDIGVNERSAWARTPINFRLENLAFTGTMVWEDPIPRNVRKLSLIPGLTGHVRIDHNGSVKTMFAPSFDAKVVLRSSMNLDLTVNPDFSQTVSDAIQVNLSRFELEYPENRLFFLENSDLFGAFGDASWGNPANRPFYSRRIGLRYDDSTSRHVTTKILGGARMSGRISDDLRIGAMSLFTEGQKVSNEIYDPAQNYSVLALQQKLFKRSSAAVMFVNKQAFGDTVSGEFRFKPGDFNRVLGFEYNFASADDQFSGKVFQHMEFKDHDGSVAYSSGLLFNHNTSKWRNWAHFTRIDKDYDPQVGYVPRNDVMGINIHGAISIYPHHQWLNQLEFLVNPHLFLDTDGTYNDHYIISGLHGIAKSTEDLWLVHIQERIHLKSGFDPLLKNDVLLAPGSVYTFNYARISYSSNQRNTFFWKFLADAGQYYNGQQIRVEGNFNYRIRPLMTLSMNYNAGRFSLEDPDRRNDIVYVGGDVEISFTRNILWTNLVQYGNLNDNINYFSRLQWRFRPLSDLYFIYNSSRVSTNENFNNQNIYCKLVYWF